MKDESGNEVSEYTLSAYESILRKRSPLRWPWFALAFAALGVVVYALTLASNAWQAKLCHEAEGTWTPAKGCVPPTIEVNHYTVTLPPQGPGGDIPTPPPVIPDNPGPAL